LLDTPWWVPPKPPLVGAVLFQKLPSGEEYLAIRETRGYNNAVVGVFSPTTGGQPVFALASNCEVYVGIISLWKDQIFGLALKDLKGGHEDFYWGQGQQLDATKPTATFADGQLGNFGDIIATDTILAWRNGIMKRADLKVIKIIPKQVTSLGNPRIAGTDVFWHNWNTPQSNEWVRRDDGSLEPFVVVESTEISGFTTDGTTMTWLQGSQPSVNSEEAKFAVWELWKAPYANKSGDLKPVKLASLPFLKGYLQGLELVMGTNYVAIDMEPPHVYRLSDGACWQVPSSPGPGLGYRKVIWVDDEEIVARIKDEYENDTTVARIKLSALTPCDPTP
jgi:hypothetical protein